VRLASRGSMGRYPAVSTIGAMIAGIPLALALGASAFAQVGHGNLFQPFVRPAHTPMPIATRQGSVALKEAERPLFNWM